MELTSDSTVLVADEFNNYCVLAITPPSSSPATPRFLRSSSNGASVVGGICVCYSRAVTESSPSVLTTWSTAHRGTFCPSSEAKRNPPFLRCSSTDGSCCATDQTGTYLTLTLPTQHTCQRCCAIIYYHDMMQISRATGNRRMRQT